MTIKAIFFDCDGVLTDSEYPKQQTMYKYLDSINLQMPHHRLDMIIGSNPKMNLWPKIFEGYVDEDKLDEFRENMSKFTRPIMSQIHYADYIYEDVPECLKQLKEKGLFICCASSSPLDYVQKILKEGKIEQYFDHVVTGHDFVESKPNPEIYLHCLEKSGFSKEECLIIEDSPIGIEAGKNSGIFTIARKDIHFNMNQSNADMIIDNFHQLVEFLEK